VIDDEVPIRRFLKASLADAEFELIEAATGREGIQQAATRAPDVILLDLGLPDMDGIEVAAAIREWSRIPIVVLSARGQEKDKVAVLDAGADDYVTKPFGIGELLARIRVALRHAEIVKGGAQDPVFEADGLRVDLPSHQVLLNGAEVKMTPTEFKLLAMLVKNVGKVLTHRQLLTEVWGAAYAEETQYLRVYMGQLRHKLEKDPARPRRLLTEPGVGYRLHIQA
jgi:two-component system KDP operon response regulator KdpE